MKCVQGCAPPPLLSSSHTSDFRGSGPRVSHGTRGERGGKLGAGGPQVTFGSWPGVVLSVSASTESSCGFSAGLEGLAPSPPLAEQPPCLSRQKLLLLSISGRTVSRRCRQGTCVHGGKARDGRPLTPHLWPHQMPLRSSPASSVPPRVTSFHTVPSQGQGPDVSLRTCISNSF